MKKTIIVALLLLAGAGDAAAQRSLTRGLLLGAHLTTSAVELDGEDASERGLGLSVTVGYGFGDHAAAFVRGEAAEIDVAGEHTGARTLGTLELGARFTFLPATSALRPYAELGVTRAGLASEVGVAPVEGSEFVVNVPVRYRGEALLLGGGLEYFVSRRAALDLGVSVGKGRFTSVEVGGEPSSAFDDTDFTTTRVRLGATLRP